MIISYSLSQIALDKLFLRGSRLSSKAQKSPIYIQKSSSSFFNIMRRGVFFSMKFMPRFHIFHFSLQLFSIVESGDSHIRDIFVGEKE